MTLLGVVATLSGCPRDPEPGLCPIVDPGELVFTEVRAPSDGNGGSLGTWIELFNASDDQLDLFGLRIEVQPISGEDPFIMLVRREGVVVEPSDYVVFGRFDDRSLPDYVDYGYERDYDKPLPRDARVEVGACDVIVDTAVYFGAPADGSLALDGAIKPSVAANDESSAFCHDLTPASGSMTDLGLPGTPGEDNTPCE